MNGNQVTKVTRKNILISLLTEWINIEKWLLSCFDFRRHQSNDSRYKDFEWDYRQHRLNNYDWEDDWFITDERLNLLGIIDNEFLEFLSYLVNPEFEIDLEKRKKSLNIINNYLIFDWYELTQINEISWEKIFWPNKIFLSDDEDINFYFEGSIHTKNLSKSKSVSTEWKQLPWIILYKNNWDDFWYNTQYFMYFLSDEISHANLIGWVKILNEKEKNTSLPQNFKNLDHSYCSVMSEQETYNDLKKITWKYYNTILKALNDITFSREAYERFQHHQWLKDSLLRESATFSLVSEKYEIDTQDWLFFAMNYLWSIINFNFNYEKIVPHRIKALIWKNWCGKTRLLWELANGIIRSKEEEFKDYFAKRPIVSKVVTISYSAFDNFSIPKDNEKISYAYCWLRKSISEVSYEIISRKELRSKFQTMLAMLEEKENLNFYKYHVKDIFEDSIDTVKNIEASFDRMSSWQKILALYFWEIIIHISSTPNSLLLFDEPETHLHPNMIFRLMKVLNKILETYDSYAIIATHSAIVIQQIPSKHVMVLKNEDEELSVSRLPFESLWENFSNITKEIFGNYENDDIYYVELFKTLINKGIKKEDILNAFGNKLSLNARIYLKSLIDKEENEED